jgi:hypothetical protein
MENVEQVKVRDLFTVTKKVVAEYKKKAEQLDQQERELNAELHVLQEEMTSNMLAQETATVPEMVYLKIEAKNINQKTDIIKVLLEELAEERKALKLEFTPIYRQAIRQDAGSRSGYSAVEITEKYKYLMLKEISDIGVQMQQQYRSISEDIYEVFEDEAVRKAYPRLEYVFNQDQYVPAFGWHSDSVVSKNEVFSAGRGYRPNKPKHMEDLEEVSETKKDVE